MNEILVAIIFALLQIAFWVVLLILAFNWFTRFLFPSAKWPKQLARKILRFVLHICFEPFKKTYQASRWLVVRAFTMHPDYNYRQLFLENYPVSPLEFYARLEEVFLTRQIVGMTFEPIARREWHLLSVRRIYFLVRFRQAACFISGVPLGTSVLISWRFTDMPSRLMLILFQIPTLGAVFERMLAPPTFYRADVFNAFEQTIRSSVLEVTELLAGQDGVRPLTEIEQRPLLAEFYE